MCWLPSPVLLAGDDEAGPRVTEAMPLPERRELRDDMVRWSAVSLSLSLSLSAMSVIAMVARWAAERRGRADMMMKAKVDMRRAAAVWWSLLFPPGDGL
jgi:hypothetical protein